MSLSVKSWYSMRPSHFEPAPCLRSSTMTALSTTAGGAGGERMAVVSSSRTGHRNDPRAAVRGVREAWGRLWTGEVGWGLMGGLGTGRGGAPSVKRLIKAEAQVMPLASR